LPIVLLLLQSLNLSLRLLQWLPCCCRKMCCSAAVAIVLPLLLPWPQALLWLCYCWRKLRDCRCCVARCVPVAVVLRVLQDVFLLLFTQGLSWLCCCWRN
jgi:hypothetical protein